VVPGCAPGERLVDVGRHPRPVDGDRGVGEGGPVPPGRSQQTVDVFVPHG